MKKQHLIKWLESQGCSKVREGGSHEQWTHPAAIRKTSVPRHREIKTPVVKAICRDLNIPVPPEK